MPPKKRDGNCAYCGEPGGITEHVFPKKLLIPGSDAMTVPACNRCNDEKSRYDLYLRDVIGLNIDIEDIPGLEFLRKAAIESAMKDDRVRPARSILVTYERKYGVLPSGDWGVVSLRTMADGDKINEAFKWIVRGIWFHDVRTVLQVDDFASESFRGANNLVGLKTRWPDFDSKAAMSVGTTVKYKLEHWGTEPPFGTCYILLYGRLFFQTRFNVSALRAATQAAGLTWQDDWIELPAN